MLFAKVIRQTLFGLAVAAGAGSASAMEADKAGAVGAIYGRCAPELGCRCETWTAGGPSKTQALLCLQDAIQALARPEVSSAIDLDQILENLRMAAVMPRDLTWASLLDAGLIDDPALIDLLKAHADSLKSYERTAPQAKFLAASEIEVPYAGHVQVKWTSFAADRCEVKTAGEGGAEVSLGTAFVANRLKSLSLGEIMTMDHEEMMMPSQSKTTLNHLTRTTNVHLICRAGQDTRLGEATLKIKVLPPPKPVIDVFTVDQSTLPYGGGDVMVSVKAHDVSDCSIEQRNPQNDQLQQTTWVGEIDTGLDGSLNTSRTIYLSANSKLVLVCHAVENQSTAAAPIDVTILPPPAAEISSFQLSETTVNYGEPITVIVTAKNVMSCSLESVSGTTRAQVQSFGFMMGWLGDQTFTTSVYLYANTNLGLTCYGPTGVAVSSASSTPVTVNYVAMEMP